MTEYREAKKKVKEDFQYTIAYGVTFSILGQERGQTESLTVCPSGKVNRFHLIRERKKRKRTTNTNKVNKRTKISTIT